MPLSFIRTEATYAKRPSFMVTVKRMFTLGIIGALSFTCLSQANAQTTVEKASQAPAVEQVPSQQNFTQELTQELTQEPEAQQTSQPILRIEETIRGNKEQPQVLTIVPWQLPVHQRINENAEWQLQINKLSSIERGAFLRNLAVVKEINTQKATRLKTTIENTVTEKNKE